MPPPSFETPLGQNVGFGGSIAAGRRDDRQCRLCGLPLQRHVRCIRQSRYGRVWLGAPNGSINLEAYTSALFAAFSAFGNQPDLLMNAVQRLYPDTHWRERLTLRYFVIPQLQKPLPNARPNGRLLPFRASLAGATNGLDSLKYRLGLIPEGTVLTRASSIPCPTSAGGFGAPNSNSGNYAIPGIDHNMTIHRQDIDDAHRRSLAGIISYFTVPSMGVTPEVAETSIEPAFGSRLDERIQAAAFPGPSTGRCCRGAAVFAGNCASCHGTYGQH